MENNYYRFTKDTVAIVQNHSEHGHLRACVLENGAYHNVEVSACKLIEWNLAQVGFSMQGSKEMARTLLGTTTMFPVCLNYEQLIYFPTGSLKNNSHVWLALHMVRGIVPLTPTSSKVLCHGPTDVVVPIPCNTLKRRWHSALVLKAKLVLATEPRLFVYGKRRQELMVICEGLRVGYEVRE